MAEVRKHGTRWRVRYKAGKKREWIPLHEGVTSHAEAKRAGARTIALLRAGAARKRADVLAPETEAFVAYGDRWFEERVGRGLTSVPADKGRWRKWIKPMLGAIPTTQMGREHLERLVASLDKAVAEKRIRWKTATNIWGVVTSMMSDACESKLAALRVRTTNPCLEVRGPTRGAELALAYVYPVEAEALLGAPKISLRYLSIYALALFAGLRAGEIEGLEVYDLDFELGAITVARSVEERTGEVKAPKNGHARRVPMHPRLVPVLRRMVAEARKAGRDRLVSMPARSGHDSLASRLRAHLQRSGVKRRDLFTNSPTTRQLTFHDLRATCITWWAIEGLDGLVIQLRAGHADLSTTSRYVRAAAGLRGIEAGAPFPPIGARLGPPAGPPAVSSSSRNPAQEGVSEQRPQRDSNPLPESPESVDMLRFPSVASPLATVESDSRHAGGQPGGPTPAPSPVELALRVALNAALDAGDHETADGLLTLLRQRGADRPSVARAGTGTGGVIDLDARRRERHGR